MRGFLNRFQIVLVSVVFLATLVLMMGILSRYNRRWDLTPEKLYTLSESTMKLLDQMKQEEIEVIAFYPNDDLREEFEIFLRECQIHHPDFVYQFYDPNRRPQLAKYWNVQELYTVIIRYQGRTERLHSANAHIFSEALLRLTHPRDLTVCFLAEEADDRLGADYEEGFLSLKTYLENHNLKTQIVNPGSENLFSDCSVLMVAGPQNDWSAQNLKGVERAFDLGGSVLFLIDPMETGTGNAFVDFFQKFGVDLGRDVIVDKMSRMIGGDFLMPFVRRYEITHEITAGLNVATFFPVARSVRIQNVPEGLEGFEIAYTGTNSWAETDLEALQEGDAVFESELDDPGPIPVAVALQMKEDPKSRFVVVGDSDFLTNAHLGIAGNRLFFMRLIRWLAKDDRKVLFNPKRLDFQPLLLSEKSHLFLLLSSLIVIPLFFFVVGMIQNVWRRKIA